MNYESVNPIVVFTCKIDISVNVKNGAYLDVLGASPRHEKLVRVKYIYICKVLPVMFHTYRLVLYFFSYCKPDTARP